MVAACHGASGYLIVDDVDYDLVAQFYYDYFQGWSTDSSSVRDFDLHNKVHKMISVCNRHHQILIYRMSQDDKDEVCNIGLKELTCV